MSIMSTTKNLDIPYLIHERFPHLGNLSSKSSDFCKKSHQRFSHSSTLIKNICLLLRCFLGLNVQLGLKIRERKCDFPPWIFLKRNFSNFSGVLYMKTFASLSWWKRRLSFSSVLWTGPINVLKSVSMGKPVRRWYSSNHRFCSNLA